MRVKTDVFDGVAWLRDEPGVRDMRILEAPEEEKRDKQGALRYLPVLLGGFYLRSDQVCGLITSRTS